MRLTWAEAMARLAVVPALLLLAPAAPVPAHADDSVAAVAPAPAPAVPASPAACPGTTTDATFQAHPAMWVVRDADTTIYLLGSVHILRPGINWFDGPIKRAFDSSDSLLLELVAPDPSAMRDAIVSVGLSTDGQSLSQRLTPEQKTVYERAMASVHLPTENFERFRPWVPGMLLSVLPLVARGYNADQGIEMILRHTAEAANKPVEGFETARQQLGFFDSLPMPSQIGFLTQASEDALSNGDQFAEMICLWANGQPDGLAELLNNDVGSDPVLRSTLLTDRNRNWAGQIAERLSRHGGTIFVAVGAGHLAGPNSLLTFLHERGIEATRVPT